MPPAVDPIQPDVHIPLKVDVVIIGGGIIGASAALFLARAKFKVALFEKSTISSEQSGRNQGWVRISNRDPREIPLAIESARYWNSMDNLVQRETGYRQAGCLFIADSEEKLEERERWASEARSYQLDAKIVSGRELEAMLPALGKKPRGALFAPYDGRAEPQKATSAIAAAAQREGALIFTNIAVRSLDIANGEIKGVVTERGRVRCDAAVVAAGAWTSIFLRRYGIRLPQLKVRSSVMKVDGIDEGPRYNMSTPDFLLRPRLDGGYTLANSENHAIDIVPDSFLFFKDFIPVLKRRWNNLPLRFGSSFFRELGYTASALEKEGGTFERYRALEPAPRTHRSLDAVVALKRWFPQFQGVTVTQHWAGLVDVTPDEVPVISKVDSVRGLTIATGFSGHGFGIGPGAGRLTADIVTGQKPIVDPEPFNLRRFVEGTWKPTRATR